MSLQLVLQIPNAMGLLAMWVVGRKHRWGWLISIGSEVVWATWGYLSHNPGIYPWCALWAIVFSRNWWLWRR